MVDNLNSKSKNAVIWDISGSIIRQVAVFVISTVLARLLGPERFGLIAMSMVFVHISNALADTGFTVGLVQQKNTKDITYSSIFYINLVISLLLSTILLFSASWISHYFEEPKIENMIRFLAIIPPLTAIGKVQEAILIKEINFKSLTIRDITATIIGGIAGLIAAFSDFGVYSLVIQQITISLAATIMLWRATKWLPKFEYSRIEVRKLFNFSGYVFLDNLLRQIFSKIDTIFIAKVFSPVILGFYSRAESLKAQVISLTSVSLNKVLFPVFSNLQDNERRFQLTFYKSSRIVSGLNALAVGILYFLSSFIILSLYGEDWKRTIILLQILILTALTSPHVNMIARAILAKGHSKLKFKIGLLQRVIRLMPLPIGFYYGIEAFAIAMVISATVVFLMLLVISSRKINLSLSIQLKNFIIPNVPLFFFLVISVIYGNIINQWVMVILFICSHLLLLVTIKHDSYLLLKNFASTAVRKLNKK